jgi:hypothetical protein
MPEDVTLEKVARAKTDQMVAGLGQQSGGHRERGPGLLDQYTVIRTGRHTQHTVAVVDLAAVAEIVVPDTGERDLPVMAAIQDDDRGDPQAEARTAVASDSAATSIVHTRRVDDDGATGPRQPGTSAVSRAAAIEDRRLGGAAGYGCRMFTARAATNRIATIEIPDSIAISDFAVRVSGIASVGLNAIEFVIDRYK